LLERHDQRPDRFDVGILDDLRRTLRRDLGANAFDRIVIEWRDAYLTEVAAALSDDLRALVTARP
jgi:hypothetical protein